MLKRPKPNLHPQIRKSGRKVLRWWMEPARSSAHFGLCVLCLMLRDWDSLDRHRVYNRVLKASFSLTPQVANSGALVGVWCARLRNNAVPRPGLSDVTD